MVFVKVIKNKQYFKRYQVQYRRRREGKTDYHRRKKLVAQDKNKYNSPKYRLVVRVTNGDVIAQVAYAKIVGDFILCAAYSHELPRYGLPVGLTNYAACYATGLLLARRLLKKLKLDTQYQGKVKADGELFSVEEAADGPHPFRALLDVGLARTTTGARIFATLKGAVDGGLNVPHSETRFRGYNPAEKKYDAAEARGYIFAKHVSDYMAQLKDEDEDKYSTHFSQYIKNGLNEGNLEAKIASVHDAIRKNPEHVAKKSSKGDQKKRFGRAKMSLSQRKDRVKHKLAAKARKAE
jgi:large subunit ribosomal protein L5e